MIDSTTNSRFSNKQLIVIYTIISLVSLLIVSELPARFTGASMFLPPASQVLAAFFRSFVEPIGKRTMLAHVGVSLYRVAVAFFFATIAGIALGVGMGYSRTFEAIFKPISPHKPGKYKISSNKTRPPPTKWDGLQPGSCTPPA